MTLRQAGSKHGLLMSRMPAATRCDGTTPIASATSVEPGRLGAYLTLKVACWVAPVVPGMRSVKVPGRIVTKVIVAVPSSSNSRLSMPSGRTSMSLMTISLTQTLRKKLGPAERELGRAVGLDRQLVVLAGLELVGRLRQRLPGRQRDRLELGRPAGQKPGLRLRLAAASRATSASTASRTERLSMHGAPPLCRCRWSVAVALSP